MLLELGPDAALSESVAVREDLDIRSADLEQGIEIPSNREQILLCLKKYFEPHINEENRRGFEALIRERAQRLDEKGETPKSVRAVFSKGVHLDRLTQLMTGLAYGFLPGSAFCAVDLMPQLTSFTHTAASEGAAIGMWVGAGDTVGKGAFGRAIANAHWLHADERQLEPVMAEARKDKQASPTRMFLESGLTGQTLTGVNVLRTAVAPLANRVLGTAGALHVDVWFSASGFVLASGLMYGLQGLLNERKNRVGAQYLLARNDWEPLYDGLKNTTWVDPLLSGSKRVAKIPVDLATDSLAIARSFGSATNLVRNGTLVGGFAAAQAAKAAMTAAAVAAGRSPVAIATAQGAVNTGILSPIFTAWVGFEHVTGPMADRLAVAMHRPVDTMGAVDGSLRRLLGMPGPADERDAPDLEAQRDTELV